ncbi:protein kinase domain-containing protein [Legionella cardiaca]|uniref:Protein kinase n=1 Tax=Legionella cardiaca TaxID=1071983 RepID=A0ABY8ARC6_9GAMM|nr:protein kinase [Legionella cardiaca]WED42776.1 protein kinase [Legionella cardiaca]
MNKFAEFCFANWKEAYQFKQSANLKLKMCLQESNASQSNRNDSSTKIAESLNRLDKLFVAYEESEKADREYSAATEQLAKLSTKSLCEMSVSLKENDPMHEEFCTPFSSRIKRGSPSAQASFHVRRNEAARLKFEYEQLTGMYQVQCNKKVNKTNELQNLNSDPERSRQLREYKNAQQEYENLLSEKKRFEKKIRELKARQEKDKDQIAVADTTTSTNEMTKKSNEQITTFENKITRLNPQILNAEKKAIQLKNQIKPLADNSNKKQAINLEIEEINENIEALKFNREEIAANIYSLMKWSPEPISYGKKAVINSDKNLLDAEFKQKKIDPSTFDLARDIQSKIKDSKKSDSFKIDKKEYLLPCSFYSIKGKLYASSEEFYFGKGGGGKVKILQAEDGKNVALKRIEATGSHPDTVPELEKISKREVTALQALNKLQGTFFSKSAIDLKTVNEPPSIYVGSNMRIQHRQGKMAEQREYIAMDVEEGISLQQFLQQHGNALTLKQKISLAIQCVQQLEQLHQRGIIHGDVKPENFQISQNKIKIIDFGTATFVGSQHSADYYEDIKFLHSACTEAYAPNTKEADYSFDIYCLGKTFSLAPPGGFGLNLGACQISEMLTTTGMTLNTVKQKLEGLLLEKESTHSYKKGLQNIKTDDDTDIDDFDVPRLMGCGS